MKTELLKKALVLSLFTNLVACGNPSVDFLNSQADSLEVDKLAEKKDVNNGLHVEIGTMSENAVVGVHSSEMPGATLGNAGTGEIINVDPVVPDDLAGEYEYRSSNLNFNLRLTNKSYTTATDGSVGLHIIPNKHHAVVQAKGECTAFGDQSEVFKFYNQISKAGSIRFTNFVANRMFPCSKTTEAVRLLGSARSFRLSIDGKLAITLSSGRVLSLKLIPIDWSKVVPMERLAQ